MKEVINVELWKRKAQYLFFKNFEEPFHGVCVNVDCTETYKEAKQEGYSLFLLYLFKMLQAANKCEPFRLGLKMRM